MSVPGLAFFIYPFDSIPLIIQIHHVMAGATETGEKLVDNIPRTLMGVTVVE